MMYTVNQIIQYPVPGVALGMVDNVVRKPAKIIRIYNIDCTDGVIVDMELFGIPGIKFISGKLLYSEKYF